MNLNVKMRNVGLGVAATFGAYLLVTLLLGIYWSSEPDAFDPVAASATYAKAAKQKPVVGYVSSVTAITLTERLLDKPGGFTANDIFPPGAWLDNMPAFEEGIVLQLRDFALVMRNDWSRSQSQSIEDEDLLVVQGQYAIDTESWAFPSAEGEYDKGAQHLQSYLVRLTDNDATDAQFYARADNLAEWLALVQKRLGALTQQLSQSVGKEQPDIDLAGDPGARQSTPRPGQRVQKTSWSQRDDVFYEARGQSYALIHLLKAAQVDFKGVLTNKNATVSMTNIIQELEPTQDTIWSPMILNGDGFGFVANHSLVMAAYLARANTAIIQLQDLLVRG